MESARSAARGSGRPGRAAARKCPTPPPSPGTPVWRALQQNGGDELEASVAKWRELRMPGWSGAGRAFSACARRAGRQGRALTLRVPGVRVLSPHSLSLGFPSCHWDPTWGRTAPPPRLQVLKSSAGLLLNPKCNPELAPSPKSWTGFFLNLWAEVLLANKRLVQVGLSAPLSSHVANSSFPEGAASGHLSPC